MLIRSWEERLLFIEFLSFSGLVGPSNQSGKVGREPLTLQGE